MSRGGREHDPTGGCVASSRGSPLSQRKPHQTCGYPSTFQRSPGPEHALESARLAVPVRRHRPAAARSWLNAQAGYGSGRCYVTWGGAGMLTCCEVWKGTSAWVESCDPPRSVNEGAKSAERRVRRPRCGGLEVFGCCRMRQRIGMRADCCTAPEELSPHGVPLLIKTLEVVTDAGSPGRRHALHVILMGHVLP